MASSIEWLRGGETWNAIRARLKDHVIMRREDGKDKLLKRGKKGWACVRISPGCLNCYSATQNENCGTNPTRAGTGLDYTVPSLSQVEIYLDEKTLLAPLHWKKTRLIFPCSMTDWMADFIPDEWRDKMLAVMALTPQHTYLTLTKRADRQRNYFSGNDLYLRVHETIKRLMGYDNPKRPAFNKCDMPLPNLWVGTSTEDQQRADERIPELLQTPVAVRWVSVEPQLESINLAKYLNTTEFTVCSSTPPKDGEIDLRTNAAFHHVANAAYRHIGGKLVDWVVVGLESGPHARPGNIEWPRQIVAQCQDAGCSVFVKQLGSKPFLHKQQSVNIDKPGLKFKMESLEINSTFKLKDRKGGDISEWPEDLQVREYPKVAEVAA